MRPSTSVGLGSLYSSCPPLSFSLSLLACPPSLISLSWRGRSLLLPWLGRPPSSGPLHSCLVSLSCASVFKFNTITYEKLTTTYDKASQVTPHVKVKQNKCSDLKSCLQGWTGEGDNEKQKRIRIKTRKNSVCARAITYDKIS